MQRNWDREREQVHHITDLIPMITEDHANPPPIVPVVSDNNSDDDYISAHQVSEGEPISGYGPTDDRKLVYKIHTINEVWITEPEN